MASEEGSLPPNDTAQTGFSQPYNDMDEANPEEIHISLRKGNQVLSEFNFGDVASVMDIPMPKLVFTLAHKMDWSTNKLREALTFQREVYLRMGNVTKQNRRYTIETFLRNSIEDGDVDKIRIILEVYKHDLQLNTASHNGDSMLMEAIRALDFPEDLDIISKLIDYGSDVNQHNHRLKEALDVAVEYRQMEIVEMLLEAGARMHTCVFRDDEPVSSYVPPLVRCARRDEVEMAELLLRAGASMDPRRYDPLKTPLRSALVKKSMKMVQLYVKCGYNISLEEFIFPTELHPEAWVPSVLKDDDNLRKSLETLAATPVSLKKQMRCFIWRYLSMKRVPIKQALDLEIPQSLIAYLLYPSRERTKLIIK